jgi:hypothetical protein
MLAAVLAEAAAKIAVLSHAPDDDERRPRTTQTSEVLKTSEVSFFNSHFSLRY